MDNTQLVDMAALCRDAVTNTNRLPVQVVEHLHRLVGGDARTEAMVLDYIRFRWEAKTLFGIPPKAASEIIRRPADFLNAVKNHCEPELSFRTGPETEDHHFIQPLSAKRTCHHTYELR